MKNTAPAVMTDAGPRGTTRKKSVDGRYTASEVEDEYTDKRQVKIHEHNQNNGKEEAIMNASVYEPLFVKTMERTFVKDLMAIKNPKQEPYLIKSNTYNDVKLGIDFQLGLRTHDENGKASFDEHNMYEIDLKVSDAFGRDEDYKESKVSLNLWKRYSGSAWEEGSLLNRNHANNFFHYIVPHSKLTKRELVNKIRREPSYDPLSDIDEVKTVLVSRDNLKGFANSRLLNNDNIKGVIEMFKNNEIRSIRNPNLNPLYNYMEEDKNSTSFKFEVPVPGESYKATLSLKTIVDENNEIYREIKILLPTRAFGSRGIPSMKTHIRFNDNPLLK